MTTLPIMPGTLLGSDVKPLIQGTLSQPKLTADSQIAFRVNLTHQRTKEYPLDSLDFIMTDLERPPMQTHHSFDCVGDLSGRLLQFWSECAEFEGKADQRLEPLFIRILRQKRPSGLFGQFADYNGTKPEQWLGYGGIALFPGLLSYYQWTGDVRALEAADGIGKFLLKNREKKLKESHSGNPVGLFITDGLALLYEETKNVDYLNFLIELERNFTPQKTGSAYHSHTFMTYLHGFQLLAQDTRDSKFNKKPSEWRKYIKENWATASGDVAETFPKSFRNEGCSIADYLRLSLDCGLAGDPEAYADAENILWNALFPNQIVNGAFGHRELTSVGLGGLNEPDAWWCCTMNCGSVMIDAAQHAVTLHGNTVKVNLLFSGDYQLKTLENKTVKVKVRTEYPSRALTYITAEFPCEGMRLELRVPDGIKEPTMEKEGFNLTEKIKLDGTIKHEIRRVGDKVMVCYGSLILSPSTCFLRNNDRDLNTAVKIENMPEEYLSPLMPSGIPELLAVTPCDKAPVFSFYEEGPASPCFVPGAPAMLKLKFDNGEIRNVYARPLASMVSALTNHDAPFLFKPARE